MSLGLFSFKARLLGIAWGGHGDGMGMSLLKNSRKLHNYHACVLCCLQESVTACNCNASCQTPPEFFPEVHNAHLCSSDNRLDPATLAASHVSRSSCIALEDLNQQFQPWLCEAHQMQAQHPDPFVFFPRHVFRFWPYPGWIPKDDSAN